ncbi:glycosyl hydrolase [Xylariaceae sp. FL0594]|nr:glycosyl hydrolase [Xylariaceae sp. FL0594]
MYVLGGPPSMEHPVSGQWEFLGRVRGMPEQWAIDGTVLEMDDGQLYLAYSGWPLDEREVYKPEEDDPLVLYRGEYDWQVDMIDDDEGGGRGRGGSDSKKKKIKHDVSGLLQHIYLLRLASPTTAGSKPAVIGSPTEEWEITRDHNSEGAAHAINEGPEWLISPDGRWRGLVYSCAASWTSEYKMATLQYIGGPPLSASSWKKAKAPLLQTRKEDGDGGVYGPGHGSFVDLGNGTVVAVYHATRGPRDGWRGRLARVQRVAFLKDGAPYMGPISPSSSSGSRSRFHNGGIKAADTSLIGKILRMFFGLGPHAAGDGGGPSGGEMKQVQMRAFLETARANRAELGVDANGSDCDGA